MSPMRRHSTLGYLRPVEFENKAMLASDGVHETGGSPIGASAPLLGTEYFLKDRCKLERPGLCQVPGVEIIRLSR